MRALVPVAVVAGLVVGSVTMLLLDDGDDVEPARPRAVPVETRAAEPANALADPVLLIWTPDGLPDDLGSHVAALDDVVRVTEVDGDPVRMVASRASDGSFVDQLTDGFVIGLDALAVEPSPYAAFLPKGAATAVSVLAPGEAILGATSATVRRLAVGGSLTLDTGEELRVAAIMDDALVGGAEVVVARGALASVTTPRFLLVEHGGRREEVERAVRELLPPGSAVRFRAPGETPLLRQGDAVLTQAQVKQQFGEFAYRPLAGRDIEIDPAWTRENIVTAAVPRLGDIRCHRTIIEELRSALVDLEQRNLGYLVTPDAISGCAVPRLVEPGGALSRHAWGIAIDINTAKNPEGEAGVQDERLVDALAATGFAWGGPWLVPDPAHFEWIGTTAPGE
jgi:hypothetical protein